MNNKSYRNALFIPLVVSLLAITACTANTPTITTFQTTSPPSTSPPTTNPPPTTPLPTGKGNPDDLIGTPGGWAYRANVIQQGLVISWSPVQTVDAAIGTSANPVTVNYRSQLETQAGQTRNIIFTVVLPNVSPSQPGNPIEAAISSNNLPAGISIVQDSGPGWHDGDPPLRVEEIVHVQIGGIVKPGNYTFSFIVSVAGVQQGMLPCTVRVLNRATS